MLGLLTELGFKHFWLKHNVFAKVFSGVLKNNYKKIHIPTKTKYFFSYSSFKLFKLSKFFQYANQLNNFSFILKNKEFLNKTCIFEMLKYRKKKKIKYLYLNDFYKKTQLESIHLCIFNFLIHKFFIYYFFNLKLKGKFYTKIR
jgi:hypothetical protein